MTTAAQKVFAIPELLEAVLLELPPYDLLMSQKVNKEFKATVERSSRIQQKLFLKSRFSSHWANIINPFLGRFSQPPWRSLGSAGLWKHYLDAPKSNKTQMHYGCSKLGISIEPEEREGIASTRLSGSFRDMLVSDPRMEDHFIHTSEGAYRVNVKTLSQLVDKIANVLGAEVARMRAKGREDGE